MNQGVNPGVPAAMTDPGPCVPCDDEKGAAARPAKLPWRRPAPAAWAAVLVLALLGAWLAVAGWRVDIEYFDGLDAICNARFMLGRSSSYIEHRMPLMGVLLAPAEAVKDALGLPPFALRPHHLTMALLHAAYLITVYLLLAARFGRSWSVLGAFLAAVPQYVFFSYAPFINHDVFPGMLFLVMLVLADRFMDAPSWVNWLGLVLAGTAAALMKHTFALCWISVLVSHCLLALLDVRGGPPRRLPFRKLAWLAGGAVLSGGVTWVSLALVVRGIWPHRNVLMGPWEAIRLIGGQYGELKGELFAAWVYVRNLTAYGCLTTALILPALGIAWRGSRLLRTTALCWVMIFTVLQCLATREVRYLACLSPLSALLLIEPLRWLLQRRWGRVAAVGLLTADLVRVVPEAWRIVQPFYSGAVLARFLGPLTEHDVPRRPVIMNAQMLSFPAPEDSPLTGDPYHKLFHLGMHHIGILFGYAEADIWRLAPGTAPDAYPLWPEGAAVVLTSNMVRNSVAWRHSPPIGKDTLLQVVALDRPPLTLTRQSDGTFRAGVGAAAAVVVREAVGQGAHVAILDGPDLVVDDETWLTARLVVAGQPIALGLVRHGPMQFAVHGNTSAQALRQAPKLTVRAIAVRAAFGARPPRR